MAHHDTNDDPGADRRALLRRLLRERVERGDATRADHPFARFVNPDLGRLLYGTGLNKSFVRGQGSWLWDAEGNRYLDFTGAYGALPFGHNPAGIWSAITEVGRREEPTFIQPSLLNAAGELAERLVAVAPAGLDRVTFANSGAEAVEAALKIARSATGRLPVLTTDNAFHGKTLGALSATGRTKYQVEFGAPVPGFTRVPFGDVEALRDALARRAGTDDQFAAFVVEPIQGEGGVHVAPPGYLAAAAELCAEHGVLLVFDEVQTGLGRTGKLFACQHEGVTPDIMTLAKALGGGVVPAAAVLSRSALVTEGFSLRHSSTFAGNTLSARVGLRTLELLTMDDGALLRHVASVGEFLADGLHELAKRYPTVVTEVRGRGFLLGVELTNDLNALGVQGLIGSLADQENLAMIVCSYLLNVERVRLAPTLFGTRVLRIEPPLTATEEECRVLLDALDRVLGLVAANDVAALLSPLVERDPATAPTGRRESPALARPADDRPAPALPPQEGDRRFGFVVHPLDLASFTDFDPGLAAFRDEELETLIKRFDAASSVLNPAPFLVGSGRVVSLTGAGAHGELVGLPYTARHLMALPRERAVRVVREAVEFARDRGAELVGLGAYSSIVTDNARRLAGVGVPVTTGNAFTASASTNGVRRAAELRGLDLAACRVAVLGAGGAIGHAVARLLAPHVGQLVLIGNPAHPEVSLRRLRDRAREVAAAVTGDSAAADLDDVVAELMDAGRLRITTEAAAAIPDAEVIITATSTPLPIIESGLPRHGAIICDVAQPPNVPSTILAERPDLLLFDGGIIAMPHGRGLGVRYGLPDGLTYACMAETMLLSLAGAFELVSVTEHLSDSAMSTLARLAEEHGFTLAALQRWRSTHGDVIPAEGQVR